MLTHHIQVLPLHNYRMTRGDKKPNICIMSFMCCSGWWFKNVIIIISLHLPFFEIRWMFVKENKPHKKSKSKQIDLQSIKSPSIQDIIFKGLRQYIGLQESTCTIIFFASWLLFCWLFSLNILPAAWHILCCINFSKRDSSRQNRYRSVRQGS